jgi:hypothetical protein
MDAAQLVARLIAAPPTRLSGLEAVIGPVAMSFANEDRENMGYLSRPPLTADDGEFTFLVASLNVRYDFDMYHDTPERPRDVRLLEYTLSVRGDRAAVEPLLAARFGAPRHIPREPFVTAVYHPFYLADGYPGFTLEWHADPPRWAIPVPSAATRTAWLEGLHDRIATAHTIDEIDAYCRPAAAAAGVEIIGTLNSGLNRYADFTFPHDDTRDYHLRFTPPVPARRLATVFGWQPATGTSGDTHMATWEIQRLGDGWYPISGALRHWELRAVLGGWPQGDTIEDETGTHRMVGDQDEVVRLAIHPRFR